MLGDNGYVLLNNFCDPDLNLFEQEYWKLRHNVFDSRQVAQFSWQFCDRLIFDSSPKYSKHQEKLWKFKLFGSSLEFSFSVICFSETWLDHLDNSTYELPNYISKHQARSDRRGGRVFIYIHNSLKFKERSDLSINNKDVESLTLEILFDKTRNVSVTFYTDHQLENNNNLRIF